MAGEPLVTLSAFADEISQDLDEAMDCLAENGIRHLELRQACGKRVIEMGDTDIREIRKKLKGRGFRLSSIGSHIGKVDVRKPFRPHLDEFKRILDRAVFLEAPFIRIFSYSMPGDPDEGRPERFRGEVMDRLAKKAELAASANVTLLHENEKGIYGDIPARCRDIFETVRHPRLRAAFDPANFVRVGVEPCEEAWPLLKDFVAYFHVKDARRGQEGNVKAGEGDGRFREILAEAKGRGFRGFCSMEPHLQVSASTYGFTGPEEFGEAVAAIKSILGAIGFPFEEPKEEETFPIPAAAPAGTGRGVGLP